MGMKSEKAQERISAATKSTEKASRSRRGKSLALPVPKSDSINQVASVLTGAAWKHSIMTEAAVQVLVDAKLLQAKEVLGWREGFANEWQMKKNIKKRQ